MPDPMNTKLKRTQDAGDTRQLLEPVHPSRAQHTVNYLVGFALGLIAVGLVVLLFWAVTGKDALIIRNDPFPVQPLVTKSEQVIHVDASLCKVTGAQGTVYRRLVSDSTELVAPTVKEGLGEGCYDHINVAVPIPPQTPPGKYHVNYRVDYKTNPLTTIREEFNSVEFEVVE